MNRAGSPIAMKSNHSDLAMIHHEFGLGREGLPLRACALKGDRGHRLFNQEKTTETGELRFALHVSTENRPWRGPARGARFTGGQSFLSERMVGHGWTWLDQQM